MVALALAACGGEPRGACDPDPPPGRLGTLCGFENPEDVEAVPSAGLVLVSEMRAPGRSGGGAIAAFAPASGGRSSAEGGAADRRAGVSRADTGAGSGVGPRAAPDLRRLWPRPPRPETAPGEARSAQASAGDPACAAPPSPERFSPHGITAAAPDPSGSVRVAAVGHRAREAIELFDLRGLGGGASLTWRGCIPLPSGVAANDVAIAGDGRIFATNYAPSLEGWRGAWSMIAGGAGRDTGAVLAWTREEGWRELPGTRAPLPNGVAVSAGDGGRSVYWAETGSGRVRRAALAGAGTIAVESADIGGYPDNLFWSPRGPLLAATHTQGFGFMLCALGREPCRSGWTAYEIDPETMQARELLHHDGARLGAVASVAEMDGRFYFGAVFGDRIGVWQPGRNGGAGR